MILSVTLNPCVDKTLFTAGVRLHDSNKVARTETDAGGKGVNLSRMAAQLGARTVATGFIGCGTGRMVVHSLEQAGAGHDFVEVAEETRTNVSVESGDGPPTVFSAPGPRVDGLEWEQLLTIVSHHCDRHAWIAMGGSLPPGAPLDAYRILGDLAHQCGARVLLDADGDAMKEGLHCGPGLIKPNLDEAERLLGRTLGSLQEARDGAVELAALMKQRNADASVALSLGEHGAVLVTPRGLWLGVPPQIQAKSSIGSGDSFLGAYLTALGKGLHERDALRSAVAAGAATALSDGTRIGTVDEVDAMEARTVVLDESDLDEIDWPAVDAWPYLGYPSETG
ncbi:MAG: 1-phosphofructokinase family hexose kinase [Armatimonadetes bacterium]|nr:1-phosphofructokinase family hexose kinase [Armatimonadota bacterium]